MKRLIAVLPAVVIALALFGCGSKDPPAASTRHHAPAASASASTATPSSTACPKGTVPNTLYAGPGCLTKAQAHQQHAQQAAAQVAAKAQARAHTAAADKRSDMKSWDRSVGLANSVAIYKDIHVRIYRDASTGDVAAIMVDGQRLANDAQAAISNPPPYHRAIYLQYANNELAAGNAIAGGNFTVGLAGMKAAQAEFGQFVGSW
jgi:hypothetical protein